jgi:hypothetical protein
MRAAKEDQPEKYEANRDTDPVGNYVKRITGPVAVPQVLNDLTDHRMGRKHCDNKNASTRARPLPTGPAVQRCRYQNQQHRKCEAQGVFDFVRVPKPGRLGRAGDPIEAPQLQQHCNNSSECGDVPPAQD